MTAKGALGIVIPTRIEAKSLLARFGFQKQGTLYHATANGRALLLAISGVGQNHARAAAHQLVDAGAKELVSMGFCGALTPDLEVGDLIQDRMATVDRPASSPAQRAAVTQKANAIAVDMETQAVIEAGTRRGVPIRVLRVVSDRSDDDLTLLLGTGDFSIGRIALRLLNPACWPLARKLQRQSAIARERLAEALSDFLKS